MEVTHKVNDIINIGCFPAPGELYRTDITNRAEEEYHHHHQYYSYCYQRLFLLPIREYLGFRRNENCIPTITFPLRVYMNKHRAAMEETVLHFASEEINRSCFHVC